MLRKFCDLLLLQICLQHNDEINEIAGLFVLFISISSHYKRVNKFDNESSK